MSEHVMIDLETWGKAPDGVIVALGAVKFDPNFKADSGTDRIIDGFYTVIDPRSCQALGMSLDTDTISWWMGPDQDAARASLAKGMKLDLASALDGFADWFGEDKPVWGNGASFDPPIMEFAFKSIGRECPWGFRSSRCFRTMKNTSWGVRMPDTPRIGTHHNALDDATWQAHHLQNIVRHLGIVVS